MAIEVIGDGNPLGTTVGKDANELAGFHGSAVAQAAVITLATGATAATIVTAVQAILTAIQNKGIMASS